MCKLAISTADLSKSYGCATAVEHLKLSVPSGTMYGFIGRNGAGKTTAIKMLVGLTRADSGSIRILGREMPGQRVPILERVAYVSESRSLYDRMTGTQMIEFSRRFYRTWSDERAMDFKVRMEVPLDRRLGKLSQGNRTKFALLLAMAQGADVLILDEPTTGLDPISVDAFFKFLTEHVRITGCTVFFSSHQLADVENVADYIGILDQGKLLLEAPLGFVTECRLITVVTDCLPAPLPQSVLSATRKQDCWRIIVTAKEENFIEMVRAASRQVEVSSINLRRLFLELAGKEAQPCTPGSVGSKPVHVFSDY